MIFDLDQAIADYCSKLKVTDSQDDAIREEVASHLREKVDHYVRANRLSEREAFLLAKDSVGDLSFCEGELREVYKSDCVVDGTVRALPVAGLLLVATFGLGLMTQLCLRLPSFAIWAALPAGSAPYWVVQLAGSIGALFLNVAICWAVYRAANQYCLQNRGHFVAAARFVRWPGIVGTVFALFVLGVVCTTGMNGMLSSEFVRERVSTIGITAESQVVLGYMSIVGRLFHPAVLTVLACALIHMCVEPRRGVWRGPCLAWGVCVSSTSLWFLFSMIYFSRMTNNFSWSSGLTLQTLESVVLAALGCVCGGLLYHYVINRGDRVRAA